MLVVEAEDGRHAVPAVSGTRRGRPFKSRTWNGEFALPAWLQPSMEGNTSLVLGEVSIPLPAGAFAQSGAGQAPTEPSPPEAPPAEGSSAERRLGRGRREGSSAEVVR